MKRTGFAALFATHYSLLTIRYSLFATCHSLSSQQIQRRGRAHHLARAAGALFHLDLALGQAARADQHLPGDADQVGGSEFGARPLVEVVIEHLDTLGSEVFVELLAGSIGVGRALLQVEDG